MSARTGRAGPLAVASLVGWTAFLAVTAVGLQHLGGALAPPPFTEPNQLSDWLAAREPAEAAFAIVRLLVLATAWYLLAATVAGTLARLAGIGSWVRAADALSVPFVRRLVNAGLGVTFAAAAVAGAGSAAVADERAGPASGATGVTMRALPDEAAPAPSATTASPAPTMRRLDDPTTTTSTPAATGPPPAPPPAGEPEPDGTRTWQIRPGEHFWGVADRVLSSAWGRSPTDHEVDPYWRTLVGANTGILRDEGNPDLLFPGQVISIPSPPAAPSS